jgi:hypothetical protein
MLSKTSRWLTYLTAFLYAILGVILFVLPGQVAPVFAWKISPFVTMTMGGWCLGNAWLAWISARRWEWRLVYSALAYLWLFGVLQLVVVIGFRDKLALEHPIAWLYLAAIGANTVTAAVGVLDAVRARPGKQEFGPAVGASWRLIDVAFILFVGFLGGYGAVVRLGAPGTNGGIFPEVLSLFTMRSFAAFYSSIALAAILLLRERNLRTYLHHSLASYGLIVAITAAALANLGTFDFAARPGGLIYLGAYLVVGIPLLFTFRRLGTGDR